MQNFEIETERDKLWKVLFLNKVDTKEFGAIGYVTDLFRIFNEVSDFTLQYSECKRCTNCNYTKNIDTITKGPIIYIPQQKRKNSFHDSYLSMLTLDEYNCPNCKKGNYKINKSNISEPRYLALLDDTLNPRSKSEVQTLKIAPSFVNKMTKNRYELISAINVPYPNHYNCLLKNPYLQFQKKSQGFFVHDGLLNDGKIVSILPDQIASLRGYLAIYRLKN